MYLIIYLLASLHIILDDFFFLWYIRLPLPEKSVQPLS